METNVTNKLKDLVTSKLSKYPEQRREVIKNIEKSEQTENKENKEDKDYLSFLNNSKDIIEIYKIIKNNKMSVREKRKKIKEFLIEPEQLNDFFNSILSTNTKNKEETKEASSTGGSSGSFEPLFSGFKKELNTKNIPTVRETKEYCDSCDRVKSKCVCDKPKKMETKEATTSASSGQYSQPAIWAKSMSKKNWKGASTKYMPGAKRVQVKEKCKKFPYCNQGDIKALKIFENESVQSAIDSVSSNYKLDKDFISEIIFNEIKKRQK